MDYLPLVDPVEKQMLSSSLFLEYKYQSTRASKDSGVDSTARYSIFLKWIV